MSEQTVTLPWPPKVLNPNAREHWAVIRHAKATYRSACHVLAKQQRISMPADAKPLISIVFVPPNRRARDIDNMLASIKAGLDGLADAMGCDDSRWRLAIEVADEIGGMVKVTVTP